MSKEYELSGNGITEIVKRIHSSDESISLEEIYQELESKEINSKMYETGFTIKEYLEDLVSVGYLSLKNGRYSKK